MGAAWGAPPQRPAAAPASLPATVANLYENLFEPGLVARLGAQVGVDPAVVEAARTQMQNLRPRREEAQQKLRTDAAALDDMVKLDHADVPQCLAQLDKVLEDEHAIKRMNLEAALIIKAKLTPQQVAQLIQLRDRLLAAGTGAGVAGVVPETLRAKMQQVQTLAQQRQQEGRDVSQVRTLMQDARTAAQAGRYKVAEEALDQILKLLNPSTLP
jgi:tetratricopeptide (TPR) repeat protein